jgi:RNA polymerase sigma factor (TIGR02999 family)
MPIAPPVHTTVPSESGPADSAAPLDRAWLDMQAELRRLAHGRLRAERDDHTLGTTALIHEVYLRLAAQRSVPWVDRAQFFVQASLAMRRILIDYARRHRRLRERLQYDSVEADAHGNGAVRLPGAQRADHLLALDEALERLAAIDPRLGRVVDCRFFAGYTEDETAAALGVTARTVTRDWAKARAWLARELRDSSVL